MISDFLIKQASDYLSSRIEKSDLSEKEKTCFIRAVREVSSSLLAETEEVYNLDELERILA